MDSRTGRNLSSQSRISARHSRRSLFSLWHFCYPGNQKGTSTDEHSMGLCVDGRTRWIWYGTSLSFHSTLVSRKCNAFKREISLPFLAVYWILIRTSSRGYSQYMESYCTKHCWNACCYAEPCHPHLPPRGWRTIGLQECHGRVEEIQAAMLVLTRGDDDMLIPIYDLYNHRNGKWFNTIAEVVPGVKHELTAARDLVSRRRNLQFLQSLYSVLQSFSYVWNSPHFSRLWLCRSLSTTMDFLQATNCLWYWWKGRMERWNVPF